MTWWMKLLSWVSGIVAVLAGLFGLYRRGVSSGRRAERIAGDQARGRAVGRIMDTADRTEDAKERSRKRIDRALQTIRERHETAQANMSPTDIDVARLQERLRRLEDPDEDGDDS